MANIERFEDIEVWKQSRILANLIYDYSEIGPFSRDYGLRDQMRRSAVSIMSNIAEGFESRSRKRFIEYLGYAKASAGELRAQLYLASDRNYLSSEDFEQASSLVENCSRQLAGFIRYLESQPNQHLGEPPPVYWSEPD